MNYKVLSRPEKIFKTHTRSNRLHGIPPGKLLSEKELCDEFKVSRTPLREAIQKLKEMKLVTVIPRFGTYVSSVDINEIRSAFEVKIKLEGLAGEVAARRITPDKLEELKALIEKADAPVERRRASPSHRNRRAVSRNHLSGHPEPDSSGDAREPPRPLRPALEFGFGRNNPPSHDHQSVERNLFFLGKKGFAESSTAHGRSCALFHRPDKEAALIKIPSTQLSPSEGGWEGVKSFKKGERP